MPRKTLIDERGASLRNRGDAATRLLGKKAVACMGV